MLKPDRQDAIVKGVLRRGTVSVADLATHLDVSEITINRGCRGQGAGPLHCSG